MRAHEILNETRAINVAASSSPRPKMVWVNPSNMEIREFLKRGELRAWVHPKYLICWLGEMALHEVVLDDLIEMGELTAEFGRLASKALIVDERGNFGNFDQWEEGEDNVLEGQGCTLLFDNWGHDVKNFRPVRRGLGIVSTEPVATDALPANLEADTIAAMRG